MSKKKPKKASKAAEKRTPQAPSTSPEPGRKNVHMEELRGILTRAKTAQLAIADVDLLSGAIETLAFLTIEIERKETSMERLRTLLFGPQTESLDKLRKKLGVDPGNGKEGPGDDEPADPTQTSSDSAAEAKEGSDDGATEATGTDDGSKKKEPEEKKKRPGHGRNGAKAYTGAKKIAVSHQTLNPGDLCGDCKKGRVYPLKLTSPLIRIEGLGPLVATVYELAQLRCNLCGRVYTANPPEGVTPVKYDETSTAMIALLKYGCGMPFYRIEALQKSLGIPLPAGTQWDLIAEAKLELEAALEALMDHAANGELPYCNDTETMIHS